MKPPVTERQRGLEHQNSRSAELTQWYISEVLARRARRPSSVSRSRGSFYGFQVVFLSVLVATTLVGINPLAGIGSSCGMRNSSSQVSEKRIAVLDQVSSSYPDPAFVAEMGSLAQKKGYRLDYYPPEAVTVSLFVDLPERAYTMIILRTHASNPIPIIATGEKYSERGHLIDQLLDNLGAVEVDGKVSYYVSSKFITRVMCGRLPGTIVLAMGCSVLVRPEMAQAFVSKGASTFVGWDSPVTVSHTDAAFVELAGLLLAGNGIRWSVNQVMEDQGPDPIYGARMVYYPIDSGSLHL